MKKYSIGKKLLVSILSIVLCVKCANYAIDRMEQMEKDTAAIIEDNIEILTGTLIYKDADVDSGETSYTTYKFKVAFDDGSVETITGNHSEYMELEVGQRIDVYKFKDSYALNEVAIVRKNTDSFLWFMLAVLAATAIFVIFVYDIYLIKNRKK